MEFKPIVERTYIRTCHTPEVRAGNYQRVALQFPDAMLPDAPAVCRLLSIISKVIESA